MHRKAMRNFSKTAQFEIEIINYSAGQFTCLRFGPRMPPHQTAPELSWRAAKYR
jgi:hypothetical protein